MKILAICGMGLGSSMILKITLEKVIRQLGLDASVDVTDITAGRSQAESADIVVTSEELAERIGGVKAQIITVKDYFDVQEMTEKLQNAIEKIKKE
ncbi:MAG: PTS sugar transporter subunit IIB [Chloroflexi bacterium]|nr:PTS sugar transporter subunit IIB [Chloroflexota bacterium]